MPGNEPKKPTNVIDFAEAYRRKQLQSDNFQFTTEAPLSITPEDALAVANEIVGKYADKQKLIEDFKKFEKDIIHVRPELLSDTSPKATAALMSRIEVEMKRMLKFREASSTESLMRVLQEHRAHPGYFGGFYLFGIAEEVVKRLAPTSLV